MQEYCIEWKWWVEWKNRMEMCLYVSLEDCNGWPFWASVIADLRRRVYQLSNTGIVIHHRRVLFLDPWYVYVRIQSNLVHNYMEHIPQCQCCTAGHFYAHTHACYTHYGFHAAIKLCGNYVILNSPYNVHAYYEKRHNNAQHYDNDSNCDA